MHIRNEKIDEIDVQYVKGVGEVRAKFLKKAGISTVEDLLNFTPRRYLDRSKIVPISHVSRNEVTTIIGKIYQIKSIPGRRRRLVVTIYDGTGKLDGVWFNQVDFFRKIFKVDQEVAFSGKINFYKGWQIVHPDYDIIEDSKEQLNTGQIIALYPGSAEFKHIGLTSRNFRKIIHNALRKYGDRIDSNLPQSLLEKYRLPNRNEAYQSIHFPKSLAELEKPLRRLKYEELFYMQLLMALRYKHNKAPESGIKMIIKSDMIEKLLKNLPFDLTGAQKKVLREIYSDLKSGIPMNRLLQGDVGSGKTVVALITFLIAFENGCQTALMAPTEILAEQHFLYFREVTAHLSINVRLLIGSLKEREKSKLHNEIQNGEIDLIIGTHALIQESVQFKKLGLVIIDEQHRFGVLQRGELTQKGWHPHLLVMTATPIPRTLALTFYGDLDVSVIDEMPAGRKSIITVWRTENKLKEIYKFIRGKINSGDQVYIIYPLVEESEKIDLKAATESFDQLKTTVFPEFTMALLHGRLNSKIKEKNMQEFKEGKIQILVSTTVVEVGVDVANATILLIEHAERFGLSQLHQLRGRVGRGKKQSYCILVTPKKINEVAQERLKLMEETNDGFKIAEDDLRLRGSGEFFGTRQHGLPDLKYSDLIEDQKIIQIARKDAFAIIEEDPQLRQPQHASLRNHFQKKYLEKYNILKIS